MAKTLDITGATGTNPNPYSPAANGRIRITALT